MNHAVKLAAVLLLAAAAQSASAQAPAPAATPPATLMSCQVQETRGSGESAEIVYNMNCMPVVGGGVTRIESTGNGEFRVTYGNGRPVFAGGPVYILHTGEEPGTAGYGAPRDGNVGTPNR
ncbi:hypothetical protein C8P66_10511 [Humitalea rosea]|uniref:Uncharacterized protein n=1 Tax=Humitalea rosea TaxID=990373 RepID=A0A2W7IRQ4_9PROT|nr:hypothetical protein [Humitalea rosea]PZW48264.1 hypothetical protein C8P66_10511 [Humitalea rosea]